MDNGEQVILRVIFPNFSSQPSLSYCDFHTSTALVPAQNM